MKVQNNTETSGKDQQTAFIEYIIEMCQKDNARAAALRRADNPGTEYQSWEILARFNIDLEKPWLRIPYATIAAAVSRGKIERNGSVGVCKVLAGCYEERNDSDQAKAKLRRLLACDSVEEACRLLRPLLRLIESKSSLTPDYAQLLRQLLRFNGESQLRVKSQWAKDFYGRQPDLPSDNSEEDNTGDRV